MYLVREHLSGRPMNFVHSAPEMPLVKDLSYISRWRMAAGHLASRSRRLSHVCIVVDDDGTQIWRASSGAGYCFAAAIENWLQKRSQTQNVTIVIPLDQRVYMAKVESGLIVQELVLVESRAADELNALSQDNSLLLFDAGGLSNAQIQSFGAFEKIPFDLRQFNYQWAPFIFLKQRMFHPLHAFLLLLPIIASLAGYWIEPAEKVVIQAAAAVVQQPGLLEVDFSAAEQVRHFARAASPKMLKLLGPDRLGSIVFKDGKLTAKGSISRFYPAKAAKFGKEQSGQFRIDGEGWQLDFLLPAKPDKRILGDRPYLDSVQAIFNAARLARGEIKLNGSVTDERLVASTFEVTLSRPTSTAFRLLAEGLANQPVGFTQANCRYKLYRTEECRFVLTARGRP